MLASEPVRPLRRQLPPVLLVAMALALVPAGAAAKSARIHLPLPGPGETVLGVTQLRFKGAAPGTLRPKLLRRDAFDPACRGLYAVYRVRRGRTTILTFVTLVLRAEAARAQKAPHETVDPVEGFQMALFFAQAGIGPSLQTGIYDTAEDRPTRPPKDLVGLLNRGGVLLAFGAPDGDLGENEIDTGHYDDGHSFGWKPAGTAKAIDTWLHLSADNAPYEKLIEKIERNLSADLDGDGKVARGGSGGVVDTEVGPPIIT